MKKYLKMVRDYVAGSWAIGLATAAVLGGFTAAREPWAAVIGAVALILLPVTESGRDTLRVFTIGLIHAIPAAAGMAWLVGDHLPLTITALLAASFGCLWGAVRGPTVRVPNPRPGGKPLDIPY